MKKLPTQDGSPKCHLSTQRDLAHLPASALTSSCHLPHTLSKSFYLCLYLFSLPPLCFCMLIPNHLYLYAPRVQTTLIPPGALCQTNSLSLAFPEVPHLNLCLSVSLHTSILSSSSPPSQVSACLLPSLLMSHYHRS